MARQASPIDLIADRHLDWMAEESPSFATYIGRPHGADRLDDESPESHAASAAHARAVLAELAATQPIDDTDRVTLAALRITLELEIKIFEANLWRNDLNVIASPAQGIREVFDISPTATETDWQNLAKRMRAVPAAVAGYIRCLQAGIEAQDTPARRQVLEVIEQVADIVGADGFFVLFARDAKPTSGQLSDALRTELAAAASEATEGYRALGSFLRDQLLPAARTEDAVGRERYALLSESFVGSKLDLDETYEWGIQELARVAAEQEAVAQQIKPGATVLEAIAYLDADPARKLHGTDALREWMQQLSDRAISELGKTHFDIAAPLRKLECMIAPTQTGGIYYTGPSDDFSRPGRMWWSVPAGVTEFDTWRETTTVYHEGVPGHHLQVAQQTYNRDQLNSWRRLASWTSGHGEGWALYAERLMADLGFLDDPGDRLGMLDGQRMRAARVVLDIGVHLGKPRLDGTGKWDFEYAYEFMSQNVNMSPEFIKFEVNRYFGWPGQAPSYKIGQRIWEQLRDEAKAEAGADFDIKAWHKRALDLGGLTLDTLRYALSL